MDKAYNPQSVEDAIYAAWEKSGYFTPEKLPNLEDRTDAYTIVLPPPNVTGTLHIGHAVMLAIEDALIRYHRLRGKRALWLPGTDHAAIATQSKVEKIIFEEDGSTRHDLGREKFLKRVEDFAQDSHDTIVNQMKKMGASVDWSREAYTLDEKRNLAVRTAFKDMFDDGLIYRGHRIVNWDPKGQTVISDDEVVRKEETTKFYYFKYGPFTIGTARPETKFADKVIVVHPEDERYTEFEHGQKLELEWINGPITATVIKDEAADMEMGSGAMTITPWHSLVDFDLAEKHDLEKVQVIDREGNLLPITGEFAGMHIKEARAKIVAKLEEKGLLAKVDEAYVHQLATAERSGEIIEPQIMEQWFIDVNKKFALKQSKSNPIEGLDDGGEYTLKEVMQHVVRNGNIEILPNRFDKTYFHWIDNLRDWNISRQLWFGHRIPAWKKDGETYVGVDAPEGEGWEQDPDTLDTWFSSGLWTFSTLGWPDKDAEDLKMYHPTNVLETGYDILFFWIARMILMTTYHMGEVPFKTAYLHGLVRDEEGRKMSKSLGNIINPLDTITEFGADATRLSLLIGASPGNDSKLSLEKIASYRNFTNKLWNISRFVLSSVEKVETAQKPEPKTLADRFILGRLSEVTEKVTNHFEKYELSLLGEDLRNFTWNEFADWYLEIAKIQKQDDALSASTDVVLLYVLERLLIMWHPFMPFVTEEIYKQFDQGMIIVAQWPKTEATLKDEDRVAYQGMQEIVTAIRNFRSTYSIAPTENLKISSGDIDDEVAGMISSLARVTVGEAEDKMIGIVTSVGKISVSIEGIDLSAQKTKLEKEIKNLAGYTKALEEKLVNKGYTSNAPKEVIEATREELSSKQKQLALLEEELANLASL
jgi:valyl-tRNA synthetase